MPKRLIFLFGIVVLGGFFIYTIGKEKMNPPLSSTLAPLFEIAGNVPKGVNSSISNLLLIKDFDEKKLGDEIALNYERRSPGHMKEIKYLNAILKTISKFSKKNFTYRGFMIESSDPNAFALPGGVLVFTTGLFEVLGSESELFSVISHEMGHVELDHCLDSVKFELAARKLKIDLIGELADLTINILARHSFSKTQEAQADEYAFKILINSPYDPYGESQAFGALKKFTDSKTPSHADVFRDYFSSHPPLELRQNEFFEKAKHWWNTNKVATRYIGKRNLKKRIPYSAQEFGQKEIRRSTDTL